MIRFISVICIASVLAACGGSGSEPSPTELGAPSSSIASLSFAKPVAYANANDVPADQIRAVDFDGDGHLDLAVVDQGNGIGLLRNRGDGTFADPVFVVSHATHVVIADLNGDGRGDIVHATTSSGLWTFYGSSDGTLHPPVQTYFDGSIASDASLVAADVDGDGLPELITCDYGTASVVRVGPDGKGVLFAAAKTHGTLFNGQGCAAGDIDGNGRPDIIKAGNDDTLGVFPSDTSGTPAAFDTPYPNAWDQLGLSGLYAPDLNGDGRADVVSAFDSNLIIRLAQPDGTLGQAVRLTPNVEPRHHGDYETPLVFADLNGDGHLDAALASRNSKGTAVAILRGDGTGRLVESNIDLGLIGGLANDVTTGDFDGDGLVDLAVAWDSRIYILRNTSR